jgi:protein-S-isoprenylcysteine O-methyltransferase Ste14
MTASAPTSRPPIRPGLLDAFERVAITGLYIWLCWRFVGTLGQNPLNAFFLISEGVVAVMILLRRSTDNISVKPLDWVTGIAGTMLPMLVSPSGGGWIGGGVFLIAGLAISLGAKFSLRRSFGVVAANRGVKRTGLYAAVRHPMYLGYFLIYAGTLMLNPSLLNAGLLAVWTVLQIARIQAEEFILMQDADYQAHARRVRFRLLPFVY